MSVFVNVTGFSACSVSSSHHGHVTCCFLSLQLPYHELEKLNGIEEVKQYLHKKLLDVTL